MKNPDGKLANKWGCDERTIRRWRRDRAPLDDNKAMPTWLAGRKHLPPGTQAIVDQKSQAAMTAAASAIVASVAIVDPATGAPAALRRLEQFESQSFKLLQGALKSGDAAAIKNARDSWLKCGDSLRRYDLLVESSRRDADETISRRDAEAHVVHFVHAMRIAGRQSSESLAPQLLQADAITISEALRTQWWDNMLSSLAMLSSQRSKTQLPPWWISAALKDLGDCWTEPGAAVDRRREALEAAFDWCVKANADQRAEALAPEAEPPAQPTPGASE